MRRSTSSLLLAALAGLAGCAPDAPTATPSAGTAPTLARVGPYTGWSPALNAEVALAGAHPSFNTEFLDGCPFISRDGKMLFMASTRPGGLGGIDIWISTRRSTSDPWSEPVNAGAPLNSAANDFCPTLARDGHTFYFVSARPGGCGGTDVYESRLLHDGTFAEPVNLGCGVNSGADEASPFPLYQPGTGLVLYFSSVRPGGYAPDAPGAPTGDSDLYMSVWRGGAFGVAALVPGANSAYEDGQPNVSRDALELYFFSNRPGTLGGPDIYVATRTNPHDVWSTPLNLGPNVNSALAETRPSLSWDGTTLYFGSNRPGGNGLSDIYVTTRERLRGVGD